MTTFGSAMHGRDTFSYTPIASALGGAHRAAGVNPHVGMQAAAVEVPHLAICGVEQMSADASTRGVLREQAS